MLEKWQNTVLLVVSAVFGAFGIWDVVSPIDQLTIEQLVTLVFLILSGLGIGVSYVVRKTRDAVQSFKVR